MSGFMVFSSGGSAMEVAAKIGQISVSPGDPSDPTAIKIATAAAMAASLALNTANAALPLTGGVLTGPVRATTTSLNYGLQIDGGDDFRRATFWPSGANHQIAQFSRIGSTGSDVAQLQSYYLVNHNGGPAGNIFNTQITTSCSAAPGEGVWNFLAQLSTTSAFPDRATAGASTQVAGYTQAVRNGIVNGTHGVSLIGHVIEMHDFVDQPSSLRGAALTLELDWAGNGIDDDDSTGVVSVDLSLAQAAGSNLLVGNGIGFYGSAQTGIKRVFDVNVPYTQAVLDTRDATQQGGNAIWLATNQTLALSTDGAWALKSDGTGIQFLHNGSVLGYWDASSGGLVNVRTYGAAGDGVTDDTAAFVAALNAAQPGGGVIAPATANGYRLASGITLPAQVTLVGTPHGGGAGNAATILLFDATVPVCVTLDGGGGNAAQCLKFVNVIRAGGSPPAGSVGVLITSAYNTVIEDVISGNHAIAWRWKANGVTGLSSMVTRLGSYAVTDTHIEIDSWPELRFSQCRFGRNGAGDYNCNSYVRFTGGEANPATHPGIGPNSIVFDNVQFNQGSNAATYWLDFKDMLGGGYTATIFLFDNCHVEGATNGVHSTALTNMIWNLWIDHTTHNVSGPFWQLDAATQLSSCKMSDTMLAGPMTLASSVAHHDLRMSGCTISAAAHLTGSGGDSAQLIGNEYQGGLTIDGAWGNLQVLGGIGSIVNNASGTVCVMQTPSGVISLSAGTAGAARGSGAIDWQALRYASSQVASGQLSVIAGGEQNAATGLHSVISGGVANNCNADNAWIPGGNSAMSWANTGRGSWASGQFITNGDAQSSEIVMRGKTTGAASVSMTTDGASPAPANIIRLWANSSVVARVQIVARVIAGSPGHVGDSAGWIAQMIISMGATAATAKVVSGAMSNTAPTFSDASLATLQVSTPIDTTNGGLSIQGFGIAGVNLQWVARVQTVETIG